MVVFIWLHRIPYLWFTLLRRDISDAGWQGTRLRGVASVL